MKFSYSSDPSRALAGHQMCFDGTHGLGAGRGRFKPPKPAQNSPQRVSMFPWRISLSKGETLFATWAYTTLAFPQCSKVILILRLFKPTVLPTVPIPTAAPHWLTHIPCPSPAPADLPSWDLCWHPASPFIAPPTPPHPSHVNWNPSGIKENSSLKGISTIP